MSKYGLEWDALEWRGHAEEAFQRAFRINPELSLTHNLYTYMEVEGGRAVNAIVRLLPLVRERTSDPELYAGLVHACRYAGLLDASIAAYERAKRLDPSIRTSVAHSFFMRGDLDRAIELDIDDPPYLTTASLLLLGRKDEAIAVCEAARNRTDLNRHLLLLLDALTAFVDGRRESGVEAVQRLLEFSAFVDPEGLYYWSYCLAGLGEVDRAIELLTRSTETGFSCLRALSLPPFQALQGDARFTAIVARVTEQQEAAARKFAEAGGPRLLGLVEPTS